MYNPFSFETFKKIIKKIVKINKKHKILFLNIHDEEIKFLYEKGYNFIKNFDGLNRKYELYEINKQ